MLSAPPASRKVIPIVKIVVLLVNSSYAQRGNHPQEPALYGAGHWPTPGLLCKYPYLTMHDTSTAHQVDRLTCLHSTANLLAAIQVLILEWPPN